jgi:hypothetical protein
MKGGFLEITSSGTKKRARALKRGRKTTREEARARGSEKAPKGREVAMGTEEEVSEGC